MNAEIQAAFGSDASQLTVTERQRLLSRILSHLAHEIRNPLGSLEVHVQLLEEDMGRLRPPVSEKMTGRIGIIRAELHRLDGVVRQFLTLARPAAVSVGSVSPAELVGRVLGLLEAEAASRSIELVDRVPGGLPALNADSGQLIQALVNLVINAIQAVGRNGRVEVSARVEGGPEAMRIDVRDTGPGIDPGKGAAIFEPFFTTKAEGNGLGLWIVQQIAVAHGGTISAANHPSGGAVFTLRLPLSAQGGPP